MRRILLLVVGVLALALAAPSVASAHHGRHHKHHHRHHHKAHGADLTGRAAGTIASFDGTTLTLTLASGATVSGAVTDETEIDLVKAWQTPMAGAAHHGGDWGGDDWDGHRGHGRCGSGDGDVSDLVVGATVLKAKLELDPDGATFEQVVVVEPASSTTS